MLTEVAQLIGNGQSAQQFRHIPSVFNKLPLDLTASFYSSAIPVMCCAVTRGLALLQPLGLIPCGRRYRLQLDEAQCFAALSAGFFCLFPTSAKAKNHQPTHAGVREWCKRYPGLNFDGLFAYPDRQDQTSKVECFIRYFVWQADRLRSYFNSLKTSGTTTTALCYDLRTINFERLQALSLIDERQAVGCLEWWILSPERLSEESVEIHQQGRIEDSLFLQADFANKSIGGGVLDAGCVQEEILFATRPELCVARLFFEELSPTEAIRITGATPFTAYSGYAHSFRCRVLTCENGPRSLRGAVVCCLDAEDYRRQSQQMQFHPQRMMRDLVKLYAALKEPDPPPMKLMSTDSSRLPFATGNWGCGAFGGDCQLKFLLQWMGCVACGRKLHYYTFKHRDLIGLSQMVDQICRCETTVGQLFGWLIKGYNEKSLRHGSVFAHITSSVGDSTQAMLRTKRSAAEMSGGFDNGE
eukprot:GHVS01009965.1.p1 GENE.GHVS01009965.1~~GHVS01009965.1.p1  ORF type:complete len:470 (+),score=63.39 GHVS01009965.1:479-1888(+)